MTSKPGDQPPAEADLNAKIRALEEKIARIKGEIRIAEGRAANGDPGIADRLRKQNDLLKGRFKILSQAMLSVLMAEMRPKQAKDEKHQNELLVKSVIEYCKKAQVDEEIWKSLES